MSHYHNDQPILGTDDSPDRLSREAFAQHLAEILVLDPKDDCLTVSLEGEWGYGKTSVIYLVRKHCLQHPQKPIIVEYNPWLGGKAEALIQDFLVQFSSQLNIPDRPKEALKAAREVLAYSKLFNAMKFIPGVEPWASTVESVFKVVGGAAKKIGQLKELGLIGRKEKVKMILGGLNKSIVVIIDDIDRLPPDEAFQVIRLIKAVADFPGTSFLLAFDSEYLSKALERQGISKADQYVEKVVQLRVPLPLIAHKDMHRLAESEFASLADKPLTEHFEKDKERLSLLYHQYVKYLVRSPRELKRIFNHLRFVFRQTEGKVCFSDIYGLSVLAIKAPKVYQYIKEMPAAYVGRNFDEALAIEKPEEIVKKHAPDRKEKIDTCSEKDRGFVTSIVNELFPLVSGGEFGESEHIYDELGRIASPKRLYTALHYQVPTGYAADTDVAAFLAGEIDRIPYLQKAISEDFVERFFELLSQNIDKIPQQNILPVLQALYDVFLLSEYLERQEDSAFGMFGFEAFRSLRWVTFGLIRKAENKPALLRELVDNAKYVFITADVIRRLMIQYGEEETREPTEKREKWLDDQTYKEIKTAWIDVAVSAMKQKEYLDSILASHVFFALKRADQTRTKEFLSELLAGEMGTEAIAKLVGRSGSDSRNGSYAQISREDFENLLDYDALVSSVNKELVANKDLSPYLRAVYLSIATGDKYYLKDGSKGEKF